MSHEDKDIIRIGVMIAGTKTSISLDGRLYYYLTKKFGDDLCARGWIRETLIRLENEWANAADTANIGDRVRANTGLSRAIQREALDELMRESSFPIATPPHGIEQSPAN